MSSKQTKPRLSAPVTSGRKGDEESVQSPKHRLVENKHDSLSEHERRLLETESRVSTILAIQRPQVVASRSLSSGSSISESTSILSSSGTESSMATNATSRASDDDEDDDEISSGHTVVGQVKKKRVQESKLQLAGGQDAAGHSDSTRPTLSTPTSSPASEVSLFEGHGAEPDNAELSICSRFDYISTTL